MHSIHIPKRNLGIFTAVFVLNVAYVGFADHAYSLAQRGVLRPNHMAAAYLLWGFLGPVVRVVTASAAVATHSESEQHVRACSWRQLIAETLRGSVKATGPVVTVVYGNILLLATQAGGAVVLLLLHVLIMSNCCYLTLQLIDVLVALRVAYCLLQGYVRAVSSVAVMVSVSSQQSQTAACHGRAALRHEWRLSRENAGRTAVLVAAEGVLTRAISKKWWYQSAVEYELEYTFWYLYVLLSGATLMYSTTSALKARTRMHQQQHEEEAGGNHEREERNGLEAAPANAAVSLVTLFEGEGQCDRYWRRWEQRSVAGALGCCSLFLDTVWKFLFWQQ